MKLSRFLVAAMLMLLSLGAWSAPALQSLQSIRAAAKAFLMKQAGGTGARVDVRVNQLDPRLRLAACGKPLAAFLPPGGQRAGNTAVGVRCSGPRPWSIYVPARVRVVQQVVVAVQPVPRGTVLTAADVRLEARDTSTLSSGYFQDDSEVLGKVVTNALATGSVLTPQIVKAPMVVRRGERVTLLAQTAGIEVRMAGKALADGALGQRIQVRSLPSKRIVEGVVGRDGVVSVDL